MPGVRGVDMMTIVVSASARAAHVRVLTIANNYQCFGAFDYVHKELLLSLRIVASGPILSTSDDQMRLSRTYLSTSTSSCLWRRNYQGT